MGHAFLMGQKRVVSKEVKQHIYCGGETPYRVYKINPYDMSTISESPAYGDTIYSLTFDGQYVYCGGITTNKVWKIDPSDMSKVAESITYSGDIRTLTNDK